MVSPAAVVDAVRASEAELQGLLRDLIGFRTESQAKEATHFPDEARRCIRYVGDFLTAHGFELDGWDVGPSATFPAHPLIVARLPGSGGGRSLAFNAHVDVVPVGDRSSWSHEPFGGEVVDGRLYGRGATDMKGGLAAAMWAAETALEQGLQPRGDIVFHVVSDEEVVGTAGVRSSSAHRRADVTISLEPKRLRRCAAEGGLVHFRIEVEGEEAHLRRGTSPRPGGKPGGGINAIEKTPKLVAALQELERQLGERQVELDPAAGVRHAFARDHRRRSGGGSDGRLNLFRTRARRRTTAPSNTTCGGTLTSRTTTCGPRSRRSSTPLPAPTRGSREHPPTAHVEARQHLLPAARRPARPSRGEHAGRLPRAGRPRSDAAGLRRRDRPRLVRRAAAAGDHLRAGRLAQCHVADEYLETEQLSLAAQVYAQMLVDWCG